jgi:hypothetical protein
MAREIFTPFTGDVAPLLRATLIHEASRAVFILAAHHTISDGVSMAAALRDMFCVLAGGTIELHPVIAPMEESLGVPRAQLSEPLDAPPPAGPPLVYRGPDNNPPRIETLKLDAALTNRLVARPEREHDPAWRTVFCGRARRKDVFAGLAPEACARSLEHQRPQGHGSWQQLRPIFRRWNHTRRARKHRGVLAVGTAFHGRSAGAAIQAGPSIRS